MTTYQSGAPLEGSRPVRYTVYWTRDPALTPGTLMPIASPVSATSIVFSPAASAMVHNERVYFAAVAVLADTGDPSLLSADLTWVVSNRGPSAPAAGSIKKK
ncbi:MAG: hypothetical protein HZB86_11955 [Deltaproteobacteria bacterium]|nr:hypothetical protein [Deltaproteobacteria bacterium]